MFRYIFREEPIAIKNKKQADPQAIGDAIEQHAAANGGKIKTRNLLVEAKANKHPMHRHIEWNDRRAAESYRLTQIQELVRIIRRVDSERPNDMPIRAFVSISDKGRSYRTIDDVLNNSNLQLILVQEGERMLQAWLQRFAELQGVCPLIQEARVHLAAEAERLRAEQQREHQRKQSGTSKRRRRGSGEREDHASL